MQKRWIPVAAPVLAGNEKKYVLDCLETTWVSSSGKYVERFETGFAEFCEAKHAASCCNGTTALHLALLALGIGLGDEVIVPTLTFVATANTVKYCGAQPVFVDSEIETWNLDPARIEEKITPRTRAIIPVHLYGHPADMDPIMEIARRHGLYVVEDAAEAHGAEYKGRKVGPIGDIGIFSFYGNKVITTGEGGMVVTNDDALAARMRQLKAQGQDPQRRYWFTIIGYNYRMTNVAAALGLAQLEQVEWHMERRFEVARWYGEDLAGSGLNWQAQQEWARHTYWMFNILLEDEVAEHRDEMMARMAEDGIETRPVFYPMHVLPPYSPDAAGLSFPVADKIARGGISLPTWSGLSREDVRFVSQSLISNLAALKRETVGQGARE
ncbi:MAG: DegT/DnrJ/EryC1/StrS family aminotransferase [Pyrinomonadaceae bacterium]